MRSNLKIPIKRFAFNNHKKTCRLKIIFSSDFTSAMKIAILNVLILSCCIFLVHLKPREGFEKSYRYFKISCSSSNKTCIKSFCYLKNTRNTSTFSAGCGAISRPVFKVYVSKVIGRKKL